MTPSEVKDMFDLGFTVAQVAAYFSITRPTVYKLLAEAGIQYTERYNELDDLQLDSVIRGIKETS